MPSVDVPLCLPWSDGHDAEFDVDQPRYHENRLFRAGQIGIDLSAEDTVNAHGVVSRSVYLNVFTADDSSVRMASPDARELAARLLRAEDRLDAVSTFEQMSAAVDVLSVDGLQRLLDQIRAEIDRRSASTCRVIPCSASPDVALDVVLV